MKLISMVDFVLEQGIPSNTDSQFADKVMSYANFLKQHLTLGMFVPCDLEGNVIKEYDWVAPEGTKWEDYEKQLLEAKDRVLFDGFRLDGRYMWHETNLFMISDNIQDSFKGRNTEFLLSCYKGAEIVLTESAKNQIFGV